MIHLDVFDFTLSDADMTAVAGLDTASTQFFDHRDPEWVRRISSRRLG